MISFIIVTYNSAATIAGCLQSILENTTEGREIIVIDNASTDDTLQIVRSFGEVTLIPLQENIGFGGANQVGFEASQHEIVVFLNPDTAIQSGFPEKVLRFFDTNPEIGILGCLIVNPDGSLERTGNTFPTFFSLLYEYSIYKYIFPGSRAHREFIIENWDRSTPRAIDVVSGACFAMQRETLNQIGGFDTGFFLYFEEYDLGRRVKSIGKKVFYEPTLATKHIGQVSTTQLGSEKRQEIYNASCRRYVLKHHGRLYSAFLWSLVRILNSPKYLVNFWRPVKRDGKI